MIEYFETLYNIDPKLMNFFQNSYENKPNDDIHSIFVGITLEDLSKICEIIIKNENWMEAKLITYAKKLIIIKEFMLF